MPDDMSAIDSEVVHNRDDVITGEVLRVTLRITGHIRWGIATRAKGAAWRAVAAARSPFPVQSGEPCLQ
jgi:hypothetical protein